jgi:hypothetical protein
MAPFGNPRVGPGLRVHFRHPATLTDTSSLSVKVARFKREVQTSTVTRLEIT